VEINRSSVDEMREQNMIEYNQMIDACHMARSHNLSALIEAEAKEAGALSTHFLLSLGISLQRC
jgi:hypothetical protein